MRGSDTFAESWLSIKKLEDFVPAKRPLGAIHVLATLVFDRSI